MPHEPRSAPVAGRPVAPSVWGARRRPALRKCCACWRGGDSGSGSGDPSAKGRQRTEEEVEALRRDIESLQAFSAIAESNILASRTRAAEAASQRAEVATELRALELGNATLCDKITAECAVEATRFDRASAAVAERRRQLTLVQAKSISEGNVSPRWRAGSERLLGRLRAECERLSVQQAERVRLSDCCIEDMLALRMTSAALLELGTKETCSIDAVRSQNLSLSKEVENVAEEIEALHVQYWKGAHNPCRVDRHAWASLRHRVLVSDREIRKLERDLSSARQAVEVAANEAAVAAMNMAREAALGEDGAAAWGSSRNAPPEENVEPAERSYPSSPLARGPSRKRRLRAVRWPWPGSREGVTGTSGLYSSPEQVAPPRLRAATDAAPSFEPTGGLPSDSPCDTPTFSTASTPCADAPKPNPAAAPSVASRERVADGVVSATKEEAASVNEAVDDLTLQRELMDALDSLRAAGEERELAEVLAGNDTLHHEIAELRERIEQRQLTEEITALRESLATVPPELVAPIAPLKPSVSSERYTPRASLLSAWTPPACPPPAVAVPLPTLLAPPPMLATHSNAAASSAAAATTDDDYVEPESNALRSWKKGAPGPPASLGRALASGVGSVSAPLAASDHAASRASQGSTPRQLPPPPPSQGGFVLQGSCATGRL